MLEEFKKFAMRGNVVDLAVAVIIGAAFSAIVNSLVGDHHHADDRRDYRRARFLQLLRSAVVKGNGGNSRRGQEARGGARLGQFSHRLPSISSSLLVRIVPCGPARQPAESAGGADRCAAPSPEVQLLTEIRDTLKSALGLDGGKAGKA